MLFLLGKGLVEGVSLNHKFGEGNFVPKKSWMFLCKHSGNCILSGGRNHVMMTQKKRNEAIKLYSLAGVHPSAIIPPLMTSDEYADLVENIRKNGFLQGQSEGYVGRVAVQAKVDLV